jgi:hypothetical protein
MKAAYGFLSLALIVFGCFGYQIYLVSQLQSQIRTLQNQNDAATRPKIIVLTYSWINEHYSQSYDRISVNCTLLNASPDNATTISIDIKAQFGTHIETYGWGVDDVLTPWQTKNYYDLGLIYNKTELGNLYVVWLEPNWIG